MNRVNPATRAVNSATVLPPWRSRRLTAKERTAVILQCGHEKGFVEKGNGVESTPLQEWILIQFTPAHPPYPDIKG